MNSETWADIFRGAILGVVISIYIKCLAIQHDVKQIKNHLNIPAVESIE